MNFESEWIEHDINPFILFSSNSKVITLNTEAQYLLGYTDKSTIFELATTYAHTTFGFKTTFLNLEFGRFKFYGITVGYENEDEIGIRLYQLPSFKFAETKPTGGDLVNIYTLVDLCISSSSTSSVAIFHKDFDPSIPEIRIMTNIFVKLLNKIYSSLKNAEYIKTTIKLKVGEHIKYDDKKYSIFSIIVEANEFREDISDAIASFSKSCSIAYDIKKSSIELHIPMITV
ncbi:MAG: hypothetical protein GQ570_03160 [Helicobacteraceae bacterium]|nr:hypothetical protein [Helicobacteraceae bacterium]